MLMVAYIAVLMMDGLKNVKFKKKKYVVFM